MSAFAEPATTPSLAAGEKLSPYLRAVLAVVLAADVLDLMDSTITTIAAPSIAHHLGGGESLIKWRGAGYALAMGVLLVVGGRLGDRYGRRRMFLVGIAGFTLASLACGLAQDPTMLIAARIVQGGFGAMLIPQGIGILTTTIPRDQQPRVFFAFGPVLGGAAVLGPILAGFVINLNIAGLDWRPIFLINIILGTAGFLAAIRLLPQDQPNRSEVIDGLGAGLLGAAMLALIYGLIQGSTNGWTTVPVACLLAGVASFVAFAWRQRAATNPLILPTLLKNKGFTAGMLLGLFYFAVVAGLGYVVSVFLQTALHRSAGQAALGLSPMMVGIIIASFASRPAATVLGRKLVFIGLTLTLVGAVWMWTIVHVGGVSISQWDLAPALLVIGAGMGACMGSMYDIAVGDITASEAGSASGSLSAVQQLASAIGSATVTTVYFSQIHHGGQAHAMTISLAIVALIAAVCLGPAFLLPRTTNPALQDEG
jgi:EmrB/QacA subfamily drug resistance transporter